MNVLRSGAPGQAVKWGMVSANLSCWLLPIIRRAGNRTGGRGEWQMEPSGRQAWV